jgi:hypothetical protein
MEYRTHDQTIRIEHIITKLMLADPSTKSLRHNIYTTHNAVQRGSHKPVREKIGKGIGKNSSDPVYLSKR